MKYDTIGIILTIIVVATGLYLALSGQEQYTQPTLYLLGTDCQDCFDISTLTIALDELGFNYTLIELTTKESQEYIETYGIQTLPSAILKGVQINTEEMPVFVENNDAYTVVPVPPPYYDIAMDKIKGLVDAKILLAECEDCFEAEILVDELQNIGVIFTNITTIEPNTQESNDLIKKYDIQITPTVIFNKELLEYEQFATIWENIGSTHDDALVLRLVNPPYINLSTGNIQGRVTLTMITDETCAECYDVKTHEGILQQNFAMKFQEQKTIDVNTAEGKKMLAKYNITNVPTIILSPDAKDYINIDQKWAEVGTKETDGHYVFRNLDLLPEIRYRDLKTRQIVSTNVSG